MFSLQASINTPVSGFNQVFNRKQEEGQGLFIQVHSGFQATEGTVE
jgi:hypothetical protein